MEKYKKKSQKNNKYKISALTWIEVFELRDGSYSVPVIQDYFAYTLENMKKRLIILQQEYM